MDINTATQALASLTGGTFVGLDTETAVVLKGGKKNLLQGRVTKRVTGSQVMCFTNNKTNAYDAMVKRRLAAEGKDPDSFVLGPRAWGERMPGTSFVQHKGAFYLEVIFMHAGKSEYLLDGQPVDVSTIDGMPEAPAATGQGGLEKQVVIRTYALDSIVTMRANGQVWQ